MAAIAKPNISLWLMALFYIVAGINHFINPAFYLPLIPDYLPFHTLINWFSGFFEVLFGIGLGIKFTKRWACYGIILLLILFIPSHIYFIQIGSCINDGLCVSPWIAWVRLLVVHPLLIFWAYKVSKTK